MAEFILKDWHGKEKTFDHETIYVRDAEDNLIPFTHGTGNPVLEELEVTENGSYAPSEGVDGFNSVKVNVPDIPAVVQPLEVTENGTYTAPDGVDGYNTVTVNVDPTKITLLKEQEISGFALDAEFGYAKMDTEPTFAIIEGEKYFVTWDGVTYETTALAADAVAEGALLLGNGSAMGLPGNGEPFAIGYINGMIAYLAFTDPAESHTVGIQKSTVKEIVLQDKTITENGEYTADEGFDGLGKVTVEVAGSDGGLEPGLYWRRSEIPNISSRTKYYQSRFVYDGKLYAAVLTYTGSGSNPETYLWNDTAWTKVVDKMDVYSDPHTARNRVLYNGKLHFINGIYHDVFDGTTYIQKANLPKETSGTCCFVQNNKLMAFAYADGNLYEWDEATDTWSVYESLGISSSPHVLINGSIYRIDSNRILKRVDGAWTVAVSFTSAATSGNVLIYDDCVYFVKDDSGYGYALWRFDPVAETCVNLGRLPFGTNLVRLYEYENKIRMLDGPNAIVCQDLIAEIVE